MDYELQAQFETTTPSSNMSNIARRNANLATSVNQYRQSSNAAEQFDTNTSQYNSFHQRPELIYTSNDAKPVSYDQALMSFSTKQINTGPPFDSTLTWQKENENDVMVLKAFGMDVNVNTAQQCSQMLEGRLPKRFRTTFSPSQLNRLEHEFQYNNYVVGLKRLRLAEELKLEEKQVKIWFQNKRMKLKRERQSIQRRIMANTAPYYF